VGLRGSGFIQATPTHPFTVPSANGEDAKQCADLTLSDCLFVRDSDNMLDQITSLALFVDEDGNVVKDYKARITCFPEHEFWAGEKEPNVLAHNTFQFC